MAEVSRKYPDCAHLYEADYVIGRAQAARAEFDEARESYHKVIRNPAASKSETAAMAQWMIGEAYMHQRNYRAALAEYLKVEILYAYPRWQAAALVQAGKCHELLNEPAAAEAAYDRLLKIQSDATFRGEATRRLESLRQLTRKRQLRR